MSPALVGGFLTTGPPGKFQSFPSCGFKTTHFLPSHPSPGPFIAHLEDQGSLLTGASVTPLTFQKTLQRIFAKCNLKHSGGKQKNKFSRQLWTLCQPLQTFPWLSFPPTSPSGLPGGTSGKEPACQCQRHGFYPWVRMLPWRRQPTLVFLPGEFHGQRTLEGYSPWGCKEVIHDWVHLHHYHTSHVFVPQKWYFHGLQRDNPPHHRPAKSYVGTLTPAPQNMTVFGDMTFKDIIKIKPSGWALVQYG